MSWEFCNKGKGGRRSSHYGSSRYCVNELKTPGSIGAPTILDALTRLAKQARDELDRMRDEEHEINGRAMDSTTEKLQ